MPAKKKAREPIRATPDGRGQVLDDEGSRTERAVSGREAVASTGGTRDIRLRWAVREGSPKDVVRVGEARARTLVAGGYAEYVDEDEPATDAGGEG